MTIIPILTPHFLRTVHRDLKTENILLEANKKFDDLKIIDFGLSSYYKGPGDPLTEMIGSPSYMSPQVMQEEPYGPKCDLWACGVIAFMALSGYLPFEGDTYEEISEQVLYDEVSFDDPAWDSVSDSAIDFVTKLLEYEEKDRLSAQEALDHPWLAMEREDSCRHFMRDSSFRATNALSNMEKFNVSNSNAFKDATYALMSAQLVRKEEREEIDEVFRMLDRHCAGHLTKEDIRSGYKEFFDKELKEMEVDEMFEKVNISGSGAIEYSEFVAAALIQNDFMDDAKLKAAFRAYDKNGTGSISLAELQKMVCFDNMDEEEFATMMRQIDQDGKGKIDFEEFKCMMLITASQPSKDIASSWKKETSAPEEEPSGETSEEKEPELVKEETKSNAVIEDIEGDAVKEQQESKTKTDLPQKDDSEANDDSQPNDEHPTHAQEHSQQPTSNKTTRAAKKQDAKLPHTATSARALFEKLINQNTAKGLESTPFKLVGSRLAPKARKNLLPAKNEQLPENLELNVGKPEIASLNGSVQSSFEPSKQDRSTEEKLPALTSYQSTAPSPSALPATAKDHMPTSATIGRTKIDKLSFSSGLLKGQSESLQNLFEDGPLNHPPLEEALIQDNRLEPPAVSEPRMMAYTDKISMIEQEIAWLKRQLELKEAELRHERCRPQSLRMMGAPVVSSPQTAASKTPLISSSRPLPSPIQPVSTPSRSFSGPAEKDDQYARVRGTWNKGSKNPEAHGKSPPLNKSWNGIMAGKVGSARQVEPSGTSDSKSRMTQHQPQPKLRGSSPAPPTCSHATTQEEEKINVLQASGSKLSFTSQRQAALLQLSASSLACGDIFEQKNTPKRRKRQTIIEKNSEKTSLSGGKTESQESVVAKPKPQPKQGNSSPIQPGRSHTTVQEDEAIKDLQASDSKLSFTSQRQAALLQLSTSSLSCRDIFEQKNTPKRRKSQAIIEKNSEKTSLSCSKTESQGAEKPKPQPKQESSSPASPTCSLAKMQEEETMEALLASDSKLSMPSQRQSALLQLAASSQSCRNVFGQKAGSSSPAGTEKKPGKSSFSCNKFGQKKKTDPPIGCISQPKGARFRKEVENFQCTMERQVSACSSFTLSRPSVAKQPLPKRHSCHDFVGSQITEQSQPE